jgi:nitrite reductase/ring-hydroxylating ferredoxin subunit
VSTAYEETTGCAAAAVQRCPGHPSTQDVIRRDGRPVPPVFALDSPRFLGSDDIPYARYTSQAFFDLEMQRVWSRTWQWACREEQIAEPGDFHVYDIGPWSVIVLRDNAGAVRAYINSCMHRGTKLKRGEGSSLDLRCPFHGWTWSLEGELTRLPSRWDFPHVDDDRFRLSEVKVGLWGGFVFVNLDPDCGPLEEHLRPLPGHFANVDMGKRYIELHIQKEFHCNWKLGWEAFVENYHTQETHPQLLTANYDEPTQYDVFSGNVTRFLSCYGVSSPHLGRALGEQELVDEILIGDRDKLDAPAIGEGETARIVLARMLRRSLADTYGSDLERFTDTEVIDVAQYGVFPNMIVFPGLSLPLAYRFRPIGTDVDRCLFELFVLRDGPRDRPNPPPAAPVRLAEHDSFATVPGFAPEFAVVFDQDTSNLRDMQEGMKSARKHGATLANYQEVRIRHLHQRLDEWLAPGPPPPNR